jgi:hypothetical protein
MPPQSAHWIDQIFLIRAVNLINLTQPGESGRGTSETAKLHLSYNARPKQWGKSGLDGRFFCI